MSLMEQIGNFAKALRQSADLQTMRALRGRLRSEEQEFQCLRGRLRSVKAPLIIRPRTTDKAVLWMIFKEQEY
jgi:tRNA C32,U32 (ribose-2'-O)-methylase TrmJ